jgi:hypothetical protein
MFACEDHAPDPDDNADAAIDEDGSALKSKHSMQAAELASLKSGLRELMEMDISAPFLKPVSEKEAPGYGAMVSDPIDLGTVMSTLRSAGYACAEDLLPDFSLIYENCLTYNNEGSEVVTNAAGVQRQGTALVKEAVKARRNSSSQGSARPSGSKSKTGTADKKSDKKFVQHALEALIKSEKAALFAKPVTDDQAEGYSALISEPMDLGTMLTKVKKGAYTAVEGMLEDFRLIYQNCLWYNKEGSEVVLSAKWVQNQGIQLVKSALKNAPPASVSSPCEKQQGRSKVQASSNGASGSKRRNESASTPDWNNSWKAALKRGLQKLMDTDEAFPFLEPVTEADAPGYGDVVSEPMDLDTMLGKLRAGSGGYTEPEDLVHDFALIFENCYVYNLEGSEVVAFAKRVQRQGIQLVRSVALQYRRHSATSPGATLAVHKQKPRGMGGAEKTALKRGLQKLMATNEAAPFLEPVSEADAPGYAAMVGEPMDLRTMVEKLEAGDYDAAECLLQDFALIFEACVAYNREDSEVVAWASALQRAGVQLVRAVVLQIRQGAGGPNQAAGGGMPGAERTALKRGLQTVMESDEALPFLEPVTEADAPGYGDLVTSPMDLGTMLSKLRQGSAGAYTTASDMLTDFTLIRENCLMYNKEGSEVVAYAKHVQRQGVQLLRTVAQSCAQSRSQHQQASGCGGGGGGGGGGGSGGGGGGHMAGGVSVPPSSRDKGSQKRKADPAAHPAGIGSAARAALTRGLQKLMETDEALPFLEPVTEADAPGYGDVVSEPMDLDTMLGKLRAGSGGYAKLEDLLLDFALIFENCVAYNLEGSEVVTYAKRVQRQGVQLVRSAAAAGSGARHLPAAGAPPRAAGAGGPGGGKAAQKRAKTEPASRRPGSAAAERDAGAPGAGAGGADCMGRAERAALTRGLQKLMETDEGLPFLEPVTEKDAPGYAAMVRDPMDLGTMLDKLRYVPQYSAQDIIADFGKLFESCVTYNTEGSEVVAFAKRVQRQGIQLVREVARQHRPDAAGGGGGGGGARGGSSSSSSASSKRRRLAATSPGMAGAERAALKQGLQALMETKEAAPFLEPVTEADAPGYTDLVSDLMDLGTMWSKLQMRPGSAGGYECAEDLLPDFGLIFENCVMYNDTGSPVVEYAKKVQRQGAQVVRDAAGRGK